MPKETLYEARIYFKSGNVVELENLEDLTVNCTGNVVTNFKWKYRDDHEGFKLLSTALDLSQIECVTFREQLGFRQF